MLFANKKVAGIFFLACVGSAHATQARVSFDPGLLKSFDGAPDIGHLDESLKAAEPNEGTYHVHLLVNSEKNGQIMPVVFSKDEQGKLWPSFSRHDYITMGVNPKAIGVSLPETDIATDTVRLDKAVKDAQSQFDLSHLTLHISLPQSTLITLAPDEVPAELWDEGIAAGVLEYQYTGSKVLTQSEGDGGDNSVDNFLNLKSGINFGAWRLRNTSTLQNDEDGYHWNSLNTFVERTLPSLKSELYAGDVYTFADTFDSVRLHGVEIASDSTMLPGSLNGFAPTVRGIANSNATVIIRDHGNVISQTHVSPGPFIISNLSPVSTGGVLDVTVKESDGTETHFQQNYATLPSLQREGQFRYALAAGRSHADSASTDSSSGNNPDSDNTDSYSDLRNVKTSGPTRNENVIQFNSMWGLTHGLTLLNGIQYAETYRALNIGLGIDMGLAGAFSLDDTLAKADGYDASSTDKGHSERANWAKHFDITNTDAQVSARQYSDEYRSFNDVITPQESEQPKKREYSFSLNQPITGSWSVYLSGSDTFYQDKTASRNWQTGLNFSLWKLQMALSFSATRQDSDGNTAQDNQVALTMMLPVAALLGAGSQASGTLSTLVNHDTTEGTSTIQQGYSDSALNSQLSWDVQAGRDYGSDSSRQASTNFTYTGAQGQLTGGYSHDSHQDRLHWGLEGGMLLHHDGITVGQYSDGAQALVSAPGISGAPLSGGVARTTDHRGYALLPNLSVYSKDAVQFDSSHFTDTASMESLSQTVIPTRDAVVLARFITHPGGRIIVSLNIDNGSPVPFGAGVKVAGDNRHFFVGDNGQTYLTGVPDTGTLLITYGDNDTCLADYDTTSAPQKSGIAIMALQCQKAKQ